MGRSQGGNMPSPSSRRVPSLSAPVARALAARESPRTLRPSVARLAARVAGVVAFVSWSVAVNASELARPSTRRPAVAQPDASVEPRWYGYQTLLADAGALLVLIAGVATNDRGTSQGIELLSGVMYAAGGPIVHIAQRRPAASLGSLGLRLGAPLAGGLLGGGLATLAPYDDGDELVWGVGIGVLGGVLAAVVLDATLLAWQTEPDVARASPGNPLGWHPRVSAGLSRVELGVVRPF